LQWQHGIQKDLNALWDKLKENYMVEIMLNISALLEKMSNVEMRYWNNMLDGACQI